jgi:transposase
MMATAAPFLGLGSQAPRHHLPGGVAPRRRPASAAARGEPPGRVAVCGGAAPVVERTFAWLGRYRRLSKDYEFLTATFEAVIYLAMTRLLRRLTGP